MIDTGGSQDRNSNRAGTWRESGADTEATERCWLLACSPWLAQSAFLSIPEPPAQGWRLPASLIKKMHVLSWVSLLSDDFSLCQVDVKLARPLLPQLAPFLMVAVNTRDLATLVLFCTVELRSGLYFCGRGSFGAESFTFRSSLCYLKPLFFVIVVIKISLPSLGQHHFPGQLMAEGNRKTH